MRAGFGMFDVLPLPYEFGLNTAATAPFQIIGAAHGATLGSGINQNVNFNRTKIRNRFIDAFPQARIRHELEFQHPATTGSGLHLAPRLRWIAFITSFCRC